MATIRKRRLVSGEMVWALTHGTGADRRRFTVGKTREEAQEALRQFERQLALHGSAPTSGTLDAVLGHYLVYLRTHRRPGTRRRYERVLRTFHSCFLAQDHPEVVSLRQVKPLHLEEYKTRRIDGSITEDESRDVRNREAALREQANQPQNAPTPRDNARFGWLGRKKLRRRGTPMTVNYELRVLQTYFRWAVRHNYLFVDPASHIERFRLPKRALPKFLTSDDLAKLFNACTPGERRLFVAILLTGMRKGEVEHLTWSDVDLELGIILIREKPEWNWKPKTDERIIPISPTLRSVLEEQWTQRRSDVLVFPNKEGHRETHMLAKLKKICRKAGITQTTVHALRHSFGAHLRMAGVPLADIADLLGHNDVATTQIYAKVHQEHLRSMISRLAPPTTDAPDAEPTNPAPEPDAGRKLLDR
jgi:integrase/recombinase XerC